jgi:hypothetical protein
MRARAQTFTVHVYGALREVQAAERVVMLKTLRCPVRVAWVYRKTQWVALMTTDLDLRVEQIIEFYSAKWKIEAGFREIKQEIGSAHTHLNGADRADSPLFFNRRVLRIRRQTRTGTRDRITRDRAEIKIVTARTRDRATQARAQPTTTRSRHTRNSRNQYVVGANQYVVEIKT